MSEVRRGESAKPLRESASYTARTWTRHRRMNAAKPNEKGPGLAWPSVAGSGPQNSAPPRQVVPVAAMFVRLRALRRRLRPICLPPRPLVAMIADLGPASAKVGLMSTRFGPTSAQFGVISAKLQPPQSRRPPPERLLGNEAWGGPPRPLGPKGPLERAPNEESGSGNGRRRETQGGTRALARAAPTRDCPRQTGGQPIHPRAHACLRHLRCLPKHHMATQGRKRLRKQGAGRGPQTIQAALRRLWPGADLLRSLGADRFP